MEPAADPEAGPGCGRDDTEEGKVIVVLLILILLALVVLIEAHMSEDDGLRNLREINRLMRKHEQMIARQRIKNFLKLILFQKPNDH